MHDFQIGRLSGADALPAETLEQMFRLRYRIFHQRLAWDVRVQGDQEQDEFDDDDAVYIVWKHPLSGEVEGSWRIRPTTRPYMLRDTFPQLLNGDPAPQEQAVWEMSRLAVTNSPYDGGTSRFGEVSRALIARTVLYGAETGVRDFIWVTSLAVERMTRRAGYKLGRLGRPTMIGSVHCVANVSTVNAYSIGLAQSHLGIEPAIIAEAA